MKFIIQGGSKLQGRVVVSGAKNAALKMIAATILIKGKCLLTNVPRIIDVERMAEILEILGGNVRWSGNNLSIDTTHVNAHALPVRISQKLRGCIVFIGPLLARFGKTTLPFPGGCAIGSRPLTAHIEAFKALGVTIEELEKGLSRRYEFRVNKNINKSVKLVERSVTATENILMFGVGHNKALTINNAAAEPEIDDLIAFLNQCGAQIKRQSPTKIIITPSGTLTGTKHQIGGDRIEAGTWMVAGTLLGKKLQIEGFNPRDLSAPIEFIKKCGGRVKLNPTGVTVSAAKRLEAQNLTTAVYPGFPTDLQSPFGLLLTQANGQSRINETLFNNRLKYLEELKNMGAEVIIKSPHEVIINGPTKLKGSIINSIDLRAGATMILAGMIAEGTTTVNQAETIDRGYESIEKKLTMLGADITRVE
jgi:UDP-N-acetylglucosamine 1-carboxyvinyltransferase